jgi:PAS domain S-box-containing protein
MRAYIRRMLLHTLSAETLALIVDAMPVRIFWKDRESRFLGCNKLFAEDAGVTDLESFVGKTDFYFYHADQARAFRMDDAHVMASGEAKLGIVEELTLETGETRWVETNKVPLRNEAGQIVGVLGTYQDVTDRIRAQRAA